MGILESLKWRYAAKKFDSTKKIAESDLTILKESVQLAASSYGLQLYKVLIVSNQEIKSQLKPASWGQGQVEDASHVFVFCNFSEITDEHIDDMVKLRSEIHKVPVEKLKGYGDFIKTTLSKFTSEDKQHWMAKQNYIALGNLMVACGELKIDSCPMEGFESDKYDEILGLKEKGLTSCVVLPVGYRSEDEPNQNSPKVRKTMEMLFEEIE